jgi:predicted lipoprotein with Yx(FWY)xxD motif
VFEPDAQGPSTCYDDCAASWPPLLTEDEPVPGAGIDDALLATAERDDGATQVTYDGWPLYHWAGDDTPGDTGGQGVGDVWWVVDPDGTPVRTATGDGGGD